MFTSEKQMIWSIENEPGKRLALLPVQKYELLKDGGEFFFVPGLVVQEAGESLQDRERHRVYDLTTIMMLSRQWRRLKIVCFSSSWSPLSFKLAVTSSRIKKELDFYSASSFTDARMPSSTDQVNSSCIRG